jgi:hypothetical protein
MRLMMVVGKILESIDRKLPPLFPHKGQNSATTIELLNHPVNPIQLFLKSVQTFKSEVLLASWLKSRFPFWET